MFLKRQGKFDVSFNIFRHFILLSFTAHFNISLQLQSHCLYHFFKELESEFYFDSATCIKMHAGYTRQHAAGSRPGYVFLPAFWKTTEKGSQPFFQAGTFWINHSINGKKSINI